MNYNYFFKDIIELYPLSEYIEFPEKSDYLTADFIEQLDNSGFYNENKIIKRIERKYKNTEIGTDTIEDFFDYLNLLIEENFSEYLMNLITISETYSIQNIDTKDISFSHKVDKSGTNLYINNDTPSNRLNIENIKSGESASNVSYTTENDVEYTDTSHQESTSALNTTQSNVEYQLKVNKLVQDALNKFVNSLSPAFSIVLRSYYE